MRSSFYSILDYSLTLKLYSFLQTEVLWLVVFFHSVRKRFYQSTAQMRPVDLKLPTCPLDDFPNSTGGGRYERTLVKAQSSNVDDMKSIHIFFRGNSIAHSSLVHMVWNVNKIGLTLKWSFIWKSFLEIWRPTLWFGFRKSVKSLLCPYPFHQNSKPKCAWLTAVINHLKSLGLAWWEGKMCEIKQSQWKLETARS